MKVCLQRNAIERFCHGLFLSQTDREWDIFLKRNTASYTKPSIFTFCSTCGAKLVFRKRKTRLQSARPTMYMTHTGKHSGLVMVCSAALGYYSQEYSALVCYLLLHSVPGYYCCA